MSGITTHVLDLSRGRPATGIRVILGRTGEQDNGAPVLAEAFTDDDGRVREELPWLIERGTYRITFDTGAYFRAQGIEPFYPEVTVTFEVTDPSQHYHVPLLLSPFGYSTYRGS
jgi:5-hydroxyisourate hydrolase